MSLHDFEEGECILTTQRHCPCIEFHPTDEERYGFHASQLLHYRLERNEAGFRTVPQEASEQLTVAFATADVVLTGTRLDRIAGQLRDGALLAVRALPNRYANLSPPTVHVACITVKTVGKE